jgi:hypothetical protein
MSEFLLWGGFVFSLLWHLPTLWIYIFLLTGSGVVDDPHRGTITILITISLGLSGVSLCAFGYFAFLPKY